MEVKDKVGGKLKMEVKDKVGGKLKMEVKEKLEELLKVEAGMDLEMEEIRKVVGEKDLVVMVLGRKSLVEQPFHLRIQMFLGSSWRLTFLAMGELAILEEVAEEGLQAKVVTGVSLEVVEHNSQLLEVDLISGCLRGLNVKNPAEKMCVPSFLDLRRIEDEVAVDATAQYGSLLLISLTEHPLIFLTCLLTEKGKCTLNSPFSLVFVTSLKLDLEFESPHSTATDAPDYNILYHHELSLVKNCTINFQEIKDSKIQEVGTDLK
ncbi:hypothetical protein ACH5RR_014191 [Cinchona calisaya]|uniref:Uncharacterized protein n=1 Tax=Cinchona calisaya TaxID=153742 RepID=A0ABD3A291_9GENT